MSNYVLFFKDDLINPADLPSITEQDGFFGVIKKPILKNYKALVWSTKMNRWVYVVYDGEEMRMVRSALGPVDCITLRELGLLRGANFSDETWTQIFTAKTVFNALIKAIKES